MKVLRVLLAAVLAVGLFAGCSGGTAPTEATTAATTAAATEAVTEAATAAPADQNLYVSYGGGTPLSIDPALNSATNGSRVIQAAHVGLMGYQPEGDTAVIKPELAESYTMSDDGLVYTFTLREGLKWSDGSDFLASEVAFSWNRAASAELGADYGFMFDVIEGYADGELNVVTDDAARTITVTLNAPTPYFLSLCAFPTFYPVKEAVVDNEGIWATKPETYIGTGAFRMTQYSVDEIIRFEKNPNFWNADEVKLETLNFRLSEDNVAILSSYETGDVSFINAIDPTEFDRINQQYPGQLVFGDYIGTYYVLFNVHKDLSPSYKQLSVQEQSQARFALGQMVNREELVTGVTKAGQVAATGFYPKGLMDGLNSDVRETPSYGSWYTATNTTSSVNAAYTEDQVTAAQTLIDLGYTYTGSLESGDLKFEGFPTIDFAFNNSGANALIIQYVQETWNRFGIPSTINTEAWATLQDKLGNGDAEAARMGWIADFNDCVNFLEIFISASGNNYPRLGQDIGEYTRNSDVTADAGLGAYWGLDGDQTWADGYDALVAQIKATTDPQERADLCAQAEKVLMGSGG
ncbi:MAG: peptide ABC transporter substrate-binding protein, partial [Clostridiales bacterium]|nr:peptide ABC transporter substrate-binding protein [Clostridiales bacterium]